VQNFATPRALPPVAIQHRFNDGLGNGLPKARPSWAAVSCRHAAIRLGRSGHRGRCFACLGGEQPAIHRKRRLGGVLRPPSSGEFHQMRPGYTWVICGGRGGSCTAKRLQLSARVAQRTLGHTGNLELSTLQGLHHGGHIGLGAEPIDCIAPCKFHTPHALPHPFAALIPDV
jgi:hypothetical protein